MTVTHHIGHVLDQLANIPDGTVDLVAASPPFLALRDYNGLEGQWGSEPDPAAFLDHLLELTTELRRVLAPHGSIAIELGDNYSGSGGAGGDYLPGGLREGQVRFDGSARAKRGTMKNDRVRSDGRPPIRNLNDKRQPGGAGWPLAKSLCLTPELYAASLAYGRNLLRPDVGADRSEWICRLNRLGVSPRSAAWLAQHRPLPPTFEPWRVRNMIVWARNNPPVGYLGDKVRPATSYITVACPSDKRWFDLDAVRTSYSANSHARTSGARQQRTAKTAPDGNRDTLDDANNCGAGAPPLDHWHDEPDGDLLWLINTQGSSLAHYAMWPPKLVSRLILSMCPAEVCRNCGQPRRRITGRTPEYAAARASVGDFKRGTSRASGLNGTAQYHNGKHIESAENVTLGWSDCGCGPGCVPATWEERDIPAAIAGGRQIATARRQRVMVDPGHCDGSHYRPGHVLDPFAGTGTTLAVADILGRDATGIDLDPHNRTLYETRWEQCWKALRPDAGPSPLTPEGQQLGLTL